jgi:tetratricopeptide (TPR) repeat protein
MNVSASLAQAARLHASGDLTAARREAETALAADPRNPVALKMVGVLYCQTGEPGIGADFLTQALTQSPTDTTTRLNAMQALLDAGRTSDAERLGKAVAAKATPELLRIRATIARKLGKPDEAIALLEEATRVAPDDYAVWNNLGNALHEADQPERAVTALERAARLRPDLSIVHTNLGRALATAGRHEESEAALEKAARLDSNDPAAVYELGRSLLRQGRAEEALPLLGKAAQLDRQDPKIFVVIGQAFARLNDMEKAENAYRVAIQVGPRHAAAYLNLAILLERGNRTDELKDLQQRAQANGMGEAEADFLQALVDRREGKLEEALALAQRASPDSLDPGLRAQFIGEVADRLGQVDTAFAAFTEMNRIAGARPDSAQSDGSGYRQFVASLTERTTPGWYASWRPAEPSASPSPAFLVGFLRSGTTLLDTILMGHPATQVMEEEPILARVETQLGPLERLAELDSAGVNALRERYFTELPTPVAPGKLLIDKNPLATLRTPLIHRIFPDARFIFALRHPCDVVLSCFMQNLLVSESMASFLDLRTAAELYDRAMTYWQKCQEVFPIKVHTVRYEDMVDDVEGEMRPLLEFLGLPWDEQILDHQRTATERGRIRTPSYAQVTEKIYQRASGRWERYRAHMEPILPILAPWVERFGYEPLSYAQDTL